MARDAGLGAVNVETVLEGGIKDIEGGEQNVAEDEAVGAAGADDEAGMSGGVTGGGNGREEWREAVLAGEVVELVGGRERREIALEVVGTLGAEVIPVGLRDEVAGAGERRAAGVAVDVPSGVIGMEVGKDDGVHLIGLAAGGGDLGEELRLAGFGVASIDENSAASRAEEEAGADHGQGALVGEETGETLGGVWDVGVDVVDGESEGSVDKSSDLDAADLGAQHTKLSKLSSVAARIADQLGGKA